MLDLNIIERVISIIQLSFIPRTKGYFPSRLWNIIHKGQIWYKVYMKYLFHSLWEIFKLDDWYFHCNANTIVKLYSPVQELERGEYVWHVCVTCNMWRGVNILSKFQLSSSDSLGVMMFWRFGGKGWLSHSLNYKGMWAKYLFGVWWDESGIRWDWSHLTSNVIHRPTLSAPPILLRLFLRCHFKNT